MQSSHLKKKILAPNNKTVNACRKFRIYWYNTTSTKHTAFFEAQSSIQPIDSSQISQEIAIYGPLTEELCSAHNKIIRQILYFDRLYVGNNQVVCK